MARAAGFTLVELLIVVAILGVLAGLALPNLTPTATEELNAAGQILVLELDRVRSLAVSYGSEYQVTFDLDQDQLVIQHVGSNTALDRLPEFAFDATSANHSVQTIALGQLPGMGTRVRLHAATTETDTEVRVADLEFQAFGGTARSSPTGLWLVVGTEASARYVKITVNPVTGLVSLGAIQTVGPNLAP